MTIEPGQRIALVGQSGSGKSTLSKILSGLYKIDTGKILFDGVNINQIDKKILSQNLGVVPQDSFLLNRSILDNITLKHEVTSQKIEEVCKAVQIYDEIMAMPMKFNTIISEMGSNISGGAKGDILYRISSLSGFRELFTNQVVGGVVDIGTILSVVIYMFLSSKTLSIIALILSLINFLFLFSTRKIMYDTVNRELQEQSLIYSVETEALNTISSIKISGLEDEIYENWSKYLKNVLTKYKKRSIVHILYNSATNVFQLFAPIIILIFGLDNVLNGKILLGEVVAFQTMASILFSSEISIFNAYTQYILAAGYLNRVNDIWLENEENVENGLKKCSLEGRIDIKDLSFSYSKDSAPVIENLNLTIESGQRIALVGQPGSGKSTLSKIPSGLYKIDTGKVLFDGVNINQIDKKILSQNLGVVPQDSFLLNRSILDNITLKHEVTSQKIEEVCKAVQIYDEIMAMPMKFNTIISEMGSNISGGQRQRIALARALINNPSIVILDEATSALDTINEERITKYIQSQGCTQIIIAHRLSTIKDADIIFVMKGGKIVESGNHKYLMDLGGEYYSLYTKRK
ncbi:lantibiotic export protein [Streptococcus pneumoniae]|uniref:peptidase domain-containing ABC transporter n=4 Tax=Streptococcus pneumoniae TaxID=1313 RepID=UPI0005E18518|nr:peptidase domain-containing ABC transporter [Streptococcus pneumoniae]CJF15582.1 lantibiotic export protein [Streptococcus pneumoniae]